MLYLQRWEKNEMKEECVLRVAEDDIRRKQQKKLKKLERKSHAKVRAWHDCKANAILELVQREAHPASAAAAADEAPVVVGLETPQRNRLSDSWLHL